MTEDQLFEMDRLLESIRPGSDEVLAINEHVGRPHVVRLLPKDPFYANAELYHVEMPSTVLVEATAQYVLGPWFFSIQEQWYYGWLQIYVSGISLGFPQTTQLMFSLRPSSGPNLTPTPSSP